MKRKKSNKLVGTRCNVKVRCVIEINIINVYLLQCHMIIKLNVNELMFLWNALDRKNCRSRDEIQKHLHHVRLIQTDKENIQYFLREIPKIPNLEQQQKLKQELDNKVVEVQMTESEKAYMLSILQHFITVNYPKGESQPGIR